MIIRWIEVHGPIAGMAPVRWTPGRIFTKMRMCYMTFCMSETRKTKNEYTNDDAYLFSKHIHNLFPFNNGKVQLLSSFG